YLSQRLRHLRASVGTVQEFRDDDRAKNYSSRRGRRQLGRDIGGAGSLAQIDHASVRIKEVRHDNGSRSSYSPCSWRRKLGSVMLPAIDSTHAAHSAWVIVFFGAAGSTVTWTSWSASWIPTGTVKRSTPSVPTRAFSVIRDIA